MGKLKNSSLHLFADEKYNSIFEYFTRNEDVKIDNKHLFILAAAIGFKNEKKIDTKTNGKEILASFFTTHEEELLMNIVMQDNSVNNNLELLNEIISTKEGRKIIEAYVNGGLELMIDEAFFDSWDGQQLSATYEHNHFDLLKFVYSQI